jgi:hypothetical protein
MAVSPDSVELEEADVPPTPSDNQVATSPRKRRGVEMVVFLLVSVIGIFALGMGTQGVFEAGHLSDLVWFAVLGGALLVIFAQMGRVHDTWPRNGKPSMRERFRQRPRRKDRVRKSPNTKGTT